MCMSIYPVWDASCCACAHACRTPLTMSLACSVLFVQGVIKIGEEREQSKVTLVYGQMNEPPGARARVALTGACTACVCAYVYGLVRNATVAHVAPTGMWEEQTRMCVLRGLAGVRERGQKKPCRILCILTCVRLRLMGIAGREYRRGTHDATCIPLLHACPLPTVTVTGHARANLNA